MQAQSEPKQRGNPTWNRRQTGAETQPSQAQAPEIKQVKAKPQAYTAIGYEVKYDETGHIHLEIERREFDGETGEKKSKPKLFIIDPAQFPSWNIYRNGYSINKVFHRPATVLPIQVDAWKKSDKGEIF